MQVQRPQHWSEQISRAKLKRKENLEKQNNILMSHISIHVLLGKNISMGY
jgi:hypothetical protein